jgi:hypothetical protein
MKPKLKPVFRVRYLWDRHGEFGNYASERLPAKDAAEAIRQAKILAEARFQKRRGFFTYGFYVDDLLSRLCKPPQSG